MATKRIHLEDIGAVTLYKRRGNRSLRLSIAADGEVRVSMPYWLPYKVGAQFAGLKAKWIAAHQASAPRLLTHGQRVGKAHRLAFIAAADAASVTTRLRDHEVAVTHPAQLAHHDQAVQDAAQAACIRALRKEARLLLPQRLRQLAATGGFSYNSVGVKQLTGRWGSCSSKQDITLNLFLMQLPWHLIDYVLLHELTHTKVMRHGPPFWQELERHRPNARALRAEIGTYQPALAAGL